MEVLCMGNNVNRHFSQNFDIFVTKITDLNSNTDCHILKGESVFRVMKLGRYVIAKEPAERRREAGEAAAF